VRFALLGGISGAIATALLYVDPDWSVQAFPWLTLAPINLIPGVVFGLIVGLALLRRSLAGPGRYGAYVAASTVSYFAAVTLAMEVRADIMDSNLLIGMAAGLFGSASLTGLSALMFPFVRKLWPCLLMLGAGCLLGGLLALPMEGEDSFLNWLVFYAAWQAGYAAGLATALPRDRPGAEI
jgi:hypothetical protein